MFFSNEYNYNPYSQINKTERYIPMDELPFLKRIASMIYTNSLSGGYNKPNNQLIELIRNRNLDSYYNNRRTYGY